MRGEQVSGEYLGRGTHGSAGGWFCTRDAGHLDDGGYLFATGAGVGIGERRRRHDPF